MEIPPPDLAHLALVRRVARRVADRLPRHADLFDDLVQWGWFGLNDALAKYDASRGVKFTTYAMPRIHGAMLDGLRSIDWVPRLVRERGEEPVGVRSMETVIFDGDCRRMTIADTLELDASPVSSEEDDAVDRLLWILPQIERELLVRHVIDGLTMKEAADEVGFSESRVSQLLGKAFSTLRRRLSVVTEDI